MQFLQGVVVAGAQIPLLLTANAFTKIVAPEMSVTKCAYLLDLSMFLFVMFSSRGQVSS